MADTATTSLRDELLADRDKITAEREPKLFELPGYGEKLQVKYRPLAREERKEITAAIFKHAQAGEERNAERGMASTLAKTCVGFYTDRGDGVVPLNEAEGLGDDLIHWGDERLAGLFDFTPTTGSKARETIEYVLGNDDVLELHHNQVTNWMGQIGGVDDADF
jgi:hypothetical protein